LSVVGQTAESSFVVKVVCGNTRRKHSMNWPMSTRLMMQKLHCCVLSMGVAMGKASFGSSVYLDMTHIVNRS
jgi:hypothetical protein